MKWFRIAVGLGLLACLSPLLMTIGAGLVADHYGCRLHEGFPNPCIIGGKDWGHTLYSFGVMGWLMLMTLPIGAMLIVAWLFAELVVFLRGRTRG